MATKPALTGFIFAVDATYTTGPVPLQGTATKIAMPVAERDEGWKADQAPPAQWQNDLVNHMTQWTNWVSLGSNLADLDAHLVETNGIGQANIAVGSFGGTAAAFSAFYASQNSGAAGEVGRFDNTGSGVALVLQSATGYALDLRQVTDAVGTPGAIAQDVRTTIPTTVAEGDLFYLGGDYHRPGFRDNNKWQYVHGTPYGHIRAYAEDDTISNIMSGGSLTSKVNVTITSDLNPVAGATVHLRAVCEISTNNAGTACQLGIVDNTAGNIICTAGDGGAGTKRTIVTRAASTLADERYVVLECDYVLPTNAPRIFFLGFISDATDITYIRFASIEITGAW